MSIPPSGPRCPICQTPLAPGATSCPNCGHVFSGSLSTLPTITGPTARDPAAPPTGMSHETTVPSIENAPTQRSSQLFSPVPAPPPPPSHLMAAPIEPEQVSYPGLASGPMTPPPAAYPGSGPMTPPPAAYSGPVSGPGSSPAWQQPAGVTGPPAPPAPRQPKGARRLTLTQVLLGALILVLLVAVVEGFLLINRPSATGVGSNPTAGPTSTPIVEVVTATPTATSVVTDTPTAETTPGATAQPTGTAGTTSPGTLLYKADWSNGPNGWGGSQDWKFLNGVLINDGTGNIDCGHSLSPTIAPPFQPQTADYAVEVKVQFIRDGGNYHNCFGIPARAQVVNGSWTGYEVMVYPGAANIRDPNTNNPLASTNFSPGTDVHTYRFEVKGTSLKVFVDGGLLVSITDAKYIFTAGQVGLWDAGIYMNVLGFAVYSL